MTQPQPKAYDLPKLSFPLCNRVLTHAAFPPEKDKQTGVAPTEQPIMWTLDGEHPLVPKHKIVRMYVQLGICVEVYSVPPAVDGKISNGVRNVIPWSQVRVVEELLDVPTFIAELEAAENESEPDPDDPEPAPKGQPGAPVVANANGGASA